MSYKISSADEYKLNFEQNDVVQSVLQNVSLILNTKKGTVPMHREFGLPMEFVDKPIDVAEALATTEIAQALGVSQMTVSRAEKAIVERFKKEMNR